MEREKRSARVLRQKGSPLVSKRPVALRVDDGARLRSGAKKGVQGFVVRIRGLNKSERRAFLHFLKGRCNFVPVEFNRTIAGASVKRLSPHATATAYLMIGPTGFVGPVMRHKYVIGVERSGCVGSFTKTTLGRKPVMRPGPKHKRPKGERYYITDPAWNDETGTIETRWASVRCK